MGIFIFDPLTGAPTLSAPNRAKRTDQTGAVGSERSEATATAINTIRFAIPALTPTESTPIESTSVESAKQKKDYFAKGNENLTPPTVYQDCDDWNVRVFSNKFPLLDDHEIIVHSPDSVKDIEDLSDDQNVRIIRAFLNRVDHFGTQEKEVIIFNNRGGKAGASILHPHSQIIAAKGFPGDLEKEKEAALHYYNEHNSCFWCDEVKRELDYQKRIVVDNPHFAVYVPEACRWSYELRLVSKKHKPNFGFIDDTEIHDLAIILRRTLTAYNNLFARPDRNFWIHTMRYEPYHWHMGFIPHIKVFGALELGAGIWVSDKAVPEDAALQLREVLKTINGHPAESSQ